MIFSSKLSFICINLYETVLSIILIDFYGFFSLEESSVLEFSDFFFSSRLLVSKNTRQFYFVAADPCFCASFIRSPFVHTAEHSR